MALKLATLLLFLLCLSQSLARDHPLDPLTPFEISTIRSIIKSSHLGSSKSLTFHYVGLDEPDVLAWQLGRRAALPRRAFVIARADRQTHELYIDISNSSITSDKIYDGFGYPAFTFEEIETASALPFNHTSFRGVGEEKRVGVEGRGVPGVHGGVVRGGEAGEEAGKLDALRDGRDDEPLHEAFGGGEDVGGFGCDGDRGVQGQKGGVRD